MNLKDYGVIRKIYKTITYPIRDDWGQVYPWIKWIGISVIITMILNWVF